MKKLSLRTRVLTGVAVAVVGAGTFGAMSANASSPAATTVQAAHHQPAKHLPSTVKAWSAAWAGSDPAALGKLFTANGTYTDQAIGATMTGPKQIAGWKARTDATMENVRVTVKDAWREGGHHITIRGVYSGHIKGAPKPFAVPSVTLLDTDGRRITANQDFYNLADVLAQSGLPADWTPSAG
ncbi:nuclear transport factor 2 family protein [Streptomyces sp. NPDC059153]|uniref:nuclear transport factor 2 family protein n=1 Tax=Streptomyces sp. NPDC059153 TaxID=3346743 RepID=UPI00368CE272